MGPCPRCGTRLLPGALACINCDLPIPAAPAEMSPPPYQVPPAQYGAPPPPYGAPPQQPWVGPTPYAPGNYPAPWTTNGLSIAGLILSILWLGGLGSLLGIIFGHVSRGQIRRRPQRGAGLSLAALIIGYFGLVGAVVFYAELPTLINSDAIQNIVVQNDIDSAASAEHTNLSATGSYTNSAVDLQNHGFSPTSISHNTILAAYNSDVGFCLVGAHNGSTTWYLYDSERGGVSDSTYRSASTAEFACSVRGIGAYAPIA